MKNQPKKPILKNKFRLCSTIIVANILLCGSPDVHAQVTIGSSEPPRQGALLDLKNIQNLNADENIDNKKYSNRNVPPLQGTNPLVTATKGLMLPRVELINLSDTLKDVSVSIRGADPNVEWPANEHIGLMVYNVVASEGIPAGIYVWNGEEWNTVAYLQSASETEDLAVAFSNEKTKQGSIIDLIRAAATKPSLDIELPPATATYNREKIAFGSTSDLGDEGLLLNSENSPALLTINGRGREIDLVGWMSGFPVITVDSGVTLTLKNITLKGLVAEEGDAPDDLSSNTAPVIMVRNGGKLILDFGAVITENENTEGGPDVTFAAAGAIAVEAGGELVMNTGAQIHTTGGWNMGAVKLNGGKFIMSGGSIRFNYSVDEKSGGGPGTGGDGGGVHVGRDGIFYMEGGDIEENMALRGGGVFVGGGIFAISMKGGNISNNYASKDGGGVYVVDTGSKFFFDGGVIHGNYADMNGGGVYVDSPDDLLSMNYNAVIRDNTAVERGGGIYLKGATFAMQHGSIRNNSVSSEGYSGGGVYLNGSSFRMSGGSITGNSVKSANGKGGGIYTGASSKFTMEAGSIAGNVINPNENAPNNANSGGRGCGLYLESNCEFTKEEGATIYGLVKSDGTGWENVILQNYYGWAVHSLPDGGDHYRPFFYENPNGDGTTPGGCLAGYAVYWDKDSGKWYNRTLTSTDGLSTDDLYGWQTECK
jgi:hypothetical protein